MKDAGEGEDNCVAVIIVVVIIMQIYSTDQRPQVSDVYTLSDGDAKISEYSLHDFKLGFTISSSPGTPVYRSSYSKTLSNHWHYIYIYIYICICVTKE